MFGSRFGQGFGAVGDVDPSASQGFLDGLDLLPAATAAPGDSGIIETGPVGGSAYAPDTSTDYAPVSYLAPSTSAASALKPPGTGSFDPADPDAIGSTLPAAEDIGKTIGEEAAGSAPTGSGGGGGGGGGKPALPFPGKTVVNKPTDPGAEPGFFASTAGKITLGVGAALAIGGVTYAIVRHSRKKGRR